MSNEHTAWFVSSLGHIELEFTKEEYESMPLSGPCDDAVTALMRHASLQDQLATITDEVLKAIGDEKDEYKAACLNAEGSVKRIETSLEIQREESEHGLAVLPAILDIETGKVRFLREL